MSWVAAAVAAVGVGTSLYGASQQRKANSQAQDQNARLQEQQNTSQWTNWLMSRGVAPTSPVAPGVMPTEGNYSAVNTRLPLWATVNLQPQPGGLRVVRRGTPAPVPALMPART